MISWNITDSEVGTYSFDIVANDGAGNITTQTFNLEIVDQDTATISGTVFEDVDNDGVFESGEPGLAGRTVYLDTNNNGQLDVGEVVQTTQSDGTFAFTGLLAGDYTVGQVLQTGFAQSLPSVSAGQTVTVSAGDSIVGIDFGNHDTGATDNGAPVITSSPIQIGKVNNQYSISFRRRILMVIPCSLIC